MEITSREDAPFGIFATFERVHHPARGRDGGGNGANGRVRLASGATLRHKGFQKVPKGERLIIEMPGGGGYGDPRTRPPALVAADAVAGLIDRETAETIYGVALTAAMAVDETGTTKLRAGG
jgi:N-methylhydantoinase B